MSEVPGDSSADYDAQMVAYAFGFAWDGFREAECDAVYEFAEASDGLAENPDESGPLGEPVASDVEGVRITTAEVIVTYRPVHVAEVLQGRPLALELARFMTRVVTEADGDTTTEITIEDHLAVLDAGFEPPLPTGEEYARPPITITAGPDGEEQAVYASPRKPASYEALLPEIKEQKRYRGLLEAVRAVRVLHGEIPELQD